MVFKITHKSTKIIQRYIVYSIFTHDISVTEDQAK